MATSQSSLTKVHPPSYILPVPNNTTNSSGNVNASETAQLCDIQLICRQRKRRGKRRLYLNFVELRSLTSTEEQPSIEILGRTTNSSIILNDCISFEYFNTIKNDFQSFIFIYFKSLTVSIYFSDEQLAQKSSIIKHFEFMYRNPRERSSTTLQSDLSTTEHILHTFDAKLIPFQSIVTRENPLIGPVRLYFTSTDLFIASIHTTPSDLKTAIINQCPSKEKSIMCIPYFTIRHYGNRAQIFLIEIGKSNYGDGEIRMKCLTSGLAKTIHLIVSPIIEERPLTLCSAFSDNLLTNKRREKSKHILPPIQLGHDVSNGPIIDLALPFIEKSSVPTLNQTDRPKTHSVRGVFRKLVKHLNPTLHSSTIDLPKQSSTSSTLNNINEHQLDSFRVPRRTCENVSLEKNTDAVLPLSTNKIQTTTMGSYIEMGVSINEPQRTVEQEVPQQEINEEFSSSIDMGVNTTISLSPHVRSAIIVGSSVHLIAEEEKTMLPIGPRSFTSPACVMQPFRAQLNSQNVSAATANPTEINNALSSSHQVQSASDSRQSLLLSYGIVTFNRNPNDSTNADSIELGSNMNSDGSVIERRLNSDFSVMSVSQSPGQSLNMVPFENRLGKSSSNSRIFRTLSVSTTNIGDVHASSRLPSHRSFFIFDERSASDQSSNYLLELPRIHSDDSHARTIPEINDENRPVNDSYALIQHELPLLTKPLKKTSDVHYTDIVLPVSEPIASNISIVDDDRQTPMMIFYADIDHHQMQRRNRLEQLAALSTTSDNRSPPFVL